MVEKIHPTAIVVCGKVPAWLPKRHPDIKIIHIQSYSEMWHEREKRKLIGRRKPTGRTTILKGGYGDASGKARRKKDDCYKDSDDDKVTENNAIEVADYYIDWGMYVVFLHEKPEEKKGRPDLLVDYKFLVEVKGIFSTKANKISNRINEAFGQIEDEWSRYPEDKPKPPGKVIILSRHETFEIGFRAFCEGYKEAKRKGFIRGEVEFWFHGEIHTFEEEEE